ncbi:MAG: hypothetical protein ACR2QO_25470 [Acidimicrobiales bacterium]
MKSLFRSFTRGSNRFGLMSDVAMVAAAAMRVAKKPAGSPSTSDASAASRISESARSVPPGEWLLVAGAAFRLLRRIRTVRRNRKAGVDVASGTIDS